MARTDNLSNFLTDIADAIRTKTGEAGTISASDFDTKIANIPTSDGGIKIDGDIEQYYVASGEEIAEGQFIEIVQGIGSKPGNHSTTIVDGMPLAGDELTYQMQIKKLVKLTDNIILADMYCSSRSSYYYGAFKYNSTTKRFEFTYCEDKKHSNKAAFAMTKAIDNWAICWDYYDSYPYPSFIYVPDDGGSIGETVKGYFQQGGSSATSFAQEWIDTGLLVFYPSSSSVLYQFVDIMNDTNTYYNNYQQYMYKDGTSTKITGAVASYGKHTDGRIILNAGGTLYLVSYNTSNGAVTNCETVCSGLPNPSNLQWAEWLNGNEYYYVTGSNGNYTLTYMEIDFDDKKISRTSSVALKINTPITGYKNPCMGLINDIWFYAIGTVNGVANKICYCKIGSRDITVYEPISLDSTTTAQYTCPFQESGIFVWNSANDFFVNNVVFPEKQVQLATTQKNDGLAKTAGIGGTVTEHQDRIQVYVPNV